eukprot:7506441-Pyramimonas_sp.AAC.1
MAPRMMKRRAQARRRQQRVMRLRQLPKTRFITKKLFSTGGLPAAVLGHQIMGTPPSLLALRRDAAASVAGTKRG